MQRSFHVILCLIILFISFGQAQAGDPLTWEDCIKIAASKNPEIQAAKENLQASEYTATSKWSAFLPQVSGVLNVNNGNSSTLSASSGTPTGGGGSDTFYSAAVSATQNVFAGFHDKATIDQAKANKNAILSTLENTKVQVSYSLKDSYAYLLYAQDWVTLSENIIKRREDNYKLVELRFEGGLENKGNAMLSKAFLGQAKYDKNVAGHDVEVAKEQLAKVLGIDEPKDIKIKGKIPLDNPDKDPNIISIALTNPLYKQAVEQEKAAKAAVTVAASQFSPTVELFATASRQGSKWFPSGDKHSFGLNLNVPFFNGGNDYYTTLSSKASYSAAKFNRETVERQLLPQLRLTYTAYLDAIQKLQVDKDFLDAATVRAEIARGKYNNGLLSFEDWDLIENDLITKQKNVIQSERNLYLAEAAWLKAQGRGVIQ